MTPNLVMRAIYHTYTLCDLSAICTRDYDALLVMRAVYHTYTLCDLSAICNRDYDALLVMRVKFCLSETLK